MAHSLKDIQAEIDKKFIHSGDMVEAIMLSHATQQPLLFHGPGGHAKTLIARTVGKMLYPDEGKVRVVLYGRGTIPSSILGGVDFVKYKEDGLLQYQPHRSWMSVPYVISDEFLDAPKPTVEQLKYIMSEREFPLADGTVYQLLTETHVGCTNHTPSKWAENESDRALLGRFPIKLEVKWPSYEPKDFQAMIAKKNSDKKLWAVSEAAGLCHAHGVKISPRDVMYIVDQFLASGDNLNVFRFHEEVAANPHLLAEIIKMAGKIAYRTKVRQLLDTILNNSSKMPKPGTDIVQNQKMIKVLTDYERALVGIRTDDQTVADVNSLLKMVRDQKDKFHQASAKAAQLTLGDVSAFALPETVTAE